MRASAASGARPPRPGPRGGAGRPPRGRAPCAPVALVPGSGREPRTESVPGACDGGARLGGAGRGGWTRALPRRRPLRRPPAPLRRLCRAGGGGASKEEARVGPGKPLPPVHASPPGAGRGQEGGDAPPLRLRAGGARPGWARDPPDVLGGPRLFLLCLFLLGPDSRGGRLFRRRGRVLLRFRLLGRGRRCPGRETRGNLPRPPRCFWAAGAEEVCPEDAPRGDFRGRPRGRPHALPAHLGGL
uniref:Uncharacterized protein n=1 Tax=Human herpesvirus 1 TaxID=10298 RepID=A0A2Z4H155_HHV1|nr:hypothetical protein [Human alphaherpesvirus 1]